ncbi:hypothetical protein [Amycolatopsis decaplanina]|uniref:Uncharacterized protein n=1 Tax=Amycolatopsis decaplanina DSM 44594 TaxID=1284240 RepID=M2WR40_9PSEU|nr:hypothetical protein [Amycolatopsis decaplanina]EME51181.1 hypothetical protein H074_37088 [Amycolatopsis decaplanina DSM 44594]
MDAITVALARPRRRRDALLTGDVPDNGQLGDIMETLPEIITALGVAEDLARTIAWRADRRRSPH